MTSFYPPKMNSSSSSYPHNPSKSRNKLRPMSSQKLSSSPPTLKSLPLQQISYPDLPSDPKKWTSSHVASYLTYCLRIYPPTIVSELSKNIEKDVTLTGRKFLRLKEEQLRQMNFNEKWIKLIMVGVKALRRDHLKDKILVNGGDIAMKVTQESSEESNEEQYSSSTRNSHKRNSSYSSTTVSSTSSNNDLKDFLIPKFSNLTFDDKKFISQEFSKLKEILKSGIDKEDLNANFNELNRVIERAISSIDTNQGENVKDNDHEKSNLMRSFFWTNVENGFAQGIIVGGFVVWALMRYSKW